MQETEETQVQSLGQEDPLEQKMATGSSILAWKNSMDRGAWWATVHWDDKELDITECTNNVRKASSRTVHIRSIYIHVYTLHIFI